MTADTQELLAAFVRDRSEAAFRELVVRYVDLVYSTALRLVEGDAHRARDVSQIVFADLAKMAAKLADGTRLGGWLHRHTCFVARTIMRGERRRQARERQAVEMNALNDDHGLAQIAPILDEAIQELGPDDRDAILLRFFERRSLRSVGEALGINENVAQKRVAQAVQELEKLLRRRGVALSAAALAGALAAGAVTAAPSGLALSIAASAWSGVATAGSAGATAAKVAIAAKLKAAIFLGVAALVVVTALVLRDQSQATTRGRLAAAPQQQADAAESDIPFAPSPAREPVNPPVVNSRGTTPIQPASEPKTAAAVVQTAQRLAPPASALPLIPTVARQSFGARSGSKVRIEGTSNVGKWQVECPFIGGSLEIDPVFAMTPGQQPQPGLITANAEIFVPVKSLRSVGSNGLPYSDKMDIVMTDVALKADQYPKIFFRLSELRLLGIANDHKVPRYEFETKGDLAIAGVTNEIIMPVSIEPVGESCFKLSGEVALQMSSFGIDPPVTKITGEFSIAPGDDIRVLVEWIFALKSDPSRGPQTRERLVPLVLDLPDPAFRGYPHYLAGSRVEPLSDRPRPAMLVPQGLANIAPSSVLSSSDKTAGTDRLAAITDGHKSASDANIVVLRKGSQWVQMDFGSPQEIYAVVIWHAHDRAKVYHDVIVQSADDKDFRRNVRTLFNNDRTNASGRGAGHDLEYIDTYEGKLIDAKGTKTRYLRFYSNGSTESVLNEYIEIEVYGRTAE